jgi:uncharacterized protein YeaO (DUF488 family)
VPLETKRWNDPRAPEDGFRLLICRFRPRGVARADETWDEWWPELGSSRELLAAWHDKDGRGPLSWEEYTRRYHEELAGQVLRIRALADRLARGERITLLCSSACTDPARCHRTLLADVLRGATGVHGRTRRARG